MVPAAIRHLWHRPHRPHRPHPGPRSRIPGVIGDRTTRNRKHRNTVTPLRHHRGVVAPPPPTGTATTVAPRQRSAARTATTVAPAKGRAADTATTAASAPSPADTAVTDAPAQGRAGGGSLLRELDACSARLDRLVGDLDPATVHPADAVAVVERVVALERRLVALRLACAPRAACATGGAGSPHRSAEHWYAQQTGVGIEAARRALATGRRLQELPDTRRQAMAGRLSEAQIDRVAEAAVRNPDREGTLLDAAGARSFRGLSELCERAKAEACSEDEEVARVAAAHRRRFLRHGRTADGAFRLEVQTTPDAGAQLMAAVDRRTRAVFDRARRQGRREPHHAYQADALVELVVGAAAVGATGGGPSDGAPARRPSAVPPDAPVPPAEPADAPVLRAEPADDRPPGDRPLPGDDPPGNEGQPSGPAAAVITFIVDVEAFRRGRLADEEVCELAGVGPVPLRMIEHWFGRSRVELVVTRGVDIASVTSFGRSIPRSLRSALRVRDGRCVVPGCDVTSPLEIDHVIPFGQGGPTELANLASLCPHHHDLKTYREWRLGGGPGCWTFAAPDRPPPRAPGSLEPPDPPEPLHPPDPSDPATNARPQSRAPTGSPASRHGVRRQSGAPAAGQPRPRPRGPTDGARGAPGPSVAGESTLFG